MERLHFFDQAAYGNSAGQPQGRALCRSGPGCCLWPPPVVRGPSGLAAMSPRRAGLPLASDRAGEQGDGWAEGSGGTGVGLLRWISKTSYFESSQSCRERAACFSILTIRLAPISSSRCELGMMIDMSPLAMTSCFDPG
jgi:hypothetical protein